MSKDVIVLKAIFIISLQFALILLPFPYFRLKYEYSDYHQLQMKCKPTSLDNKIQLCYSVYHKYQKAHIFSKGIQVLSIHDIPFKVLLFETQYNVNRGQDYFQFVDVFEYTDSGSTEKKLDMRLTSDVEPKYFVDQFQGTFLQQNMTHGTIFHYSKTIVFYQLKNVDQKVKSNEVCHQRIVTSHNKVMVKSDIQVRVPNQNSVLVNTLIFMAQAIFMSSVILIVNIVKRYSKPTNQKRQKSKFMFKKQLFLLAMHTTYYLFYYFSYCVLSRQSGEYKNGNILSRVKYMREFHNNWIVADVQQISYNSFLNSVGYFYFMSAVLSFETCQLDKSKNYLTSLNWQKVLKVCFFALIFTQKYLFYFIELAVVIVLVMYIYYHAYWYENPNINNICNATNLLILELLKIFWVDSYYESQDFAVRYVWMQIFLKATLLSILRYNQSEQQAEKAEKQKTKKALKKDKTKNDEDQQAKMIKKKKKKKA